MAMQWMSSCGNPLHVSASSHRGCGVWSHRGCDIREVLWGRSGIGCKAFRGECDWWEKFSTGERGVFHMERRVFHRSRGCRECGAVRGVLGGDVWGKCKECRGNLRVCGPAVVARDAAASGGQEVAWKGCGKGCGKVWIAGRGAEYRCGGDSLKDNAWTVRIWRVGESSGMSGTDDAQKKVMRHRRDDSR
jgi:hypothetical protein